jgi:PIN domain nuclease of toxin-antitoxin system
VTILLDTHALHWWASEPNRLSAPAVRAIDSADELAVAATSWYELARLVHRGRIGTSVPARAYVEGLARDVRTVAMTPSIAVAAAELPKSFPGDPADRQIYATALELGWRLVTVDRDMHAHDPRGTIVLW